MFLYVVMTFASALFALASVSSNDSCGINEWQCGDGSCIGDAGFRCDGVLHCRDGSDEAHCRPSRATKPGCVYPELPNDKTYFITDLGNARPGDVFDSIFINVTCQEGYGVNGSSQIFCVGGFWGYGATNEIAKCVRRCYLPRHSSVEYKCILTGSSFGIRDCNKYEFEGTEVIPTCRTPIYHAPFDLPYMKCQNGVWDNEPKCVPDCGSVTPVGTGLIINGTNAERGEMPWHAGIYDKDWNPYMQVCGGSIISTQVVLSAAHCFWSDTAGPLPASKYAVAVGKLYRPWNDKNDEAQKSEVKEIHLSDHYQGTAANHQDDIAVLLMETAFEYQLHIRPVCVDFNIVFQNRQLTPGSVGKISGWGLTAANSSASSPILQVIELPYVSIDTCIAESPIQFRGFITSDKFCAGFKNGGKALCQGDSGGGLAFSGVHLRDMERFFLRGITSTAPSKDGFGCNPDTYITFTLIQKHEHFIKRYWTGEDDVWKLQAGDTEASRLANCIMPYSNNITTYKTTNTAQVAPGGAYPFLKLDISCARGYSLEGTSRFDCYNGTWFPSNNIPECAADCRLPKIFGVDYQCVDHDSKTPEDGIGRQCFAGDVLPSGEDVEVFCKPYYQPGDASAPSSGSMKCTNGSWVTDYIPTCYGVCGKRDVLHSRAPWNVAIFNRGAKPYAHACDGVLLAERLLLTAARCFWSGGQEQPADKFVVAAGKSSWEWREDDNRAQIIDITSIHTPNRSKSYQEDIAIVLLKDYVEYSLDVLPACIDSQYSFTSDIKNGVNGKVATWSKKLGGIDEIDMPYHGVFDICRTDPPPDAFVKAWCRSDITTSWFPCSNDKGTNPGTGWVYSKNQKEDFIEKYYLRGIAFMKQECDSPYPVFTNLQKKHRNFMRKVLSEMFNSTSPLQDLNKIGKYIFEREEKSG